ncbi:GntR family transcriptional regulator [Aequitasia blattaphilus]|uniref:GntR family transcriptional regulator n=1 Tax=Aequitasia blattaphilus TaxID=2949332 RepID=A0ABT1E9Y3_9FIRM|nr:GntR family transcriptional regulator [Aequitasia blattaphilus]MCP1102646.1 GntR family transcriptional regulator [Aequitasia blattaphilus]MCR8615286.1 GntR family transcriptional regulator [Aequitasia blattaphilus]
MILKIDFDSEEAIYIQLRNQIIIGIAYQSVKEGDSLPSVRQLANTLGINMHTVNKAYSVLREEGYIGLDRRKGAYVRVNEDKEKILSEIKNNMRILIAKSRCKNVSKEDIYQLIDEVFQEFQ